MIGLGSQGLLSGRVRGDCHSRTSIVRLQGHKLCSLSSSARICNKKPQRRCSIVSPANRPDGGSANPMFEPDAGEFDENEDEELFEDEDEFDEVLSQIPGMAGNVESDEFEEMEEPSPDMLSELQDELGYGENEAEEMARQERLGRAQEAASSSRGAGDGLRFPEPEERGYYISDLFGKAAYVDVSVIMDHDFPDTAVYGLQNDPEKVIKGDMYICLCWDEEDMRVSIQTALSNGAAALLLPPDAEDIKDLEVPADVPVHYVMDPAEVAQRLAVAFYDAPARDLMVIGVVGSHGKTTVSWLICGILEAMDQVTGTINSVGYSLSGDPLDVDGDLWQAPEDDDTDEQESSAPFRITPYHEGRYNVPASTPIGMQVQKLLAGMRDRGATCAVVECSNTALATGHCRFLDLGVAVHTNFTDAGIDNELFEGDRERMLEAQMELFDSLIDPSAQAAVVNLDDPVAEMVIDRTGAMPIVTYGIDNTAADVVAESARFTIWESEIIVRTPLGKLQIITPLLGKHNVYNVLAAVATGIALKVPLIKIVAGIEAVDVIPGRCEIVDEGQDFSVIVDAADTPEALDAMLSALRGNAKNIYTVFGCRGEEDRSIRAHMAEVAHAKSDVVIMTNDSPRREPPEAIIKDLVAGLPDEVVNKYSGYVYFPFQDQGYVPLWFEPYLQKAQRDNKRYIMEDRFSAIRAAIGTAGENDVVVIAGRGHCDFMEYWDGEEGVVRGWFDDRVEARSALQKLSILQQLDGKLDRKHLPWGKALDQMDTIISM